MLIFERNSELKIHLDRIRAESRQIGFVPTMGALHAGHISLINESKKQGLFTVCSIFVNPTQFNDKKDLENYPRTPQADIEMLRQSGCDALFMPTTEEVYPKEDVRIFNFGELETVLEGAHRPGHFNGVAKVVSILFDKVHPDLAFFGSKDYQQVMIVKALVKQLNLPIEIVPCSIIREPDGLAMSSRNMRLTKEEREAAKLIPLLLNESKIFFKAQKPILEIKAFIASKLAQKSIYKLEYFEICNSESLQILTDKKEVKQGIALIACFVGNIRLIDNLILD
ncbi:MAG: pantoate--beta-alanine ligase [Sphingobacteriaceae bacterium]|nr:pantoate--beta-alanine ligase [Sphingobacteriaceae bacterium]